MRTIDKFKEMAFSIIKESGGWPDSALTAPFIDGFYWMDNGRNLPYIYAISRGYMFTISDYFYWSISKSMD